MRNKKPIETFKQGEHLTVAEGEYSDYCVNGLFRVVRDFDAQEQLVLWAAETGRELTEGAVEHDDSEKITYIPWLAKHAFLEDVDYRELHIRSYGTTALNEHKPMKV